MFAGENDDQMWSCAACCNVVRTWKGAELLVSSSHDKGDLCTHLNSPAIATTNTMNHVSLRVYRDNFSSTGGPSFTSGVVGTSLVADAAAGPFSIGLSSIVVAVMAVVKEGEIP